MVRVAGLVLMIGMGWISAGAQRVETAPSYAPLEISFNYSYARANGAPGECGCFNMNGGSSEVAFHAFRALSVVADLTGERATAIGATAGVGLSLVAFTVGPRFSHSFSGGKFTPFVQGLVGVAHGFDGLFPSSSGSLSGAASARAVLAGGGLDLTINQHLAIRAIQADYLRTQLPNGQGDEQNLLRSGRASSSASGKQDGALRPTWPPRAHHLLYMVCAGAELTTHVNCTRGSRTGIFAPDSKRSLTGFTMVRSPSPARRSQ